MSRIFAQGHRPLRFENCYFPGEYITSARTIYAQKPLLFSPCSCSWGGKRENSRAKCVTICRFPLSSIDVQYSLITSYFNLNVSQPGFFPEAESICGSGLSFIIVKQRLFGMVWYGVWPYGQPLQRLPRASTMTTYSECSGVAILLFADLPRSSSSSSSLLQLIERLD